MKKLTRSILIRKFLHILTAIIPISYIFLNRFSLVLSLGILGISAVIIDLLRLKVDSIGNFFSLHFGKLFWEREKHTLTGATHYVVSAFLSIYLFEKWIAIAVLLFLSLGDTAAHLIGVKWGRISFNSEKTIEGSVACLVICIGISILLPHPSIIVLISGSIVASLIEFLPLGIDDNLTLPLVAGVAMEILTKI